ncbi:hypothetical protein D9M72_606250 [compost metagenome]
MPTLMYRDRLALRGEKPILSQSTSLPVVALLYLLVPNPMRELPHKTGSSPLASFIISKITKLSFRFCSSEIVLIKSSTLATVGLVLISASFDFFSAIVHLFGLFSVVSSARAAHFCKDKNMPIVILNILKNLVTSLYHPPLI